MLLLKKLGNVIIREAHEEKIGNSNYIIIEYKNTNDNISYAVYREFLNDKTIALVLDPKNSDYKNTIKEIESFIDTSYELPTYETIKYLSSTITYTIPDKFIKTHGLKKLDKPVWYYAKYENGSNIQSGYEFSVELRDESSNISVFKSVDEIVNYEYDKYKRWKDEEYYLNLNLSEIKELRVNNKVVKYFSVSYDLEMTDDLRKQECAYFVYPVDDKQDLFLVIEAKASSKTSIDINEIKGIVESIKQ